VLPACVLRLAGENQSKCLGLAFLLAAAPAGMAWSAGRRGRTLRVAVLAASALPTLAMMAWAYAHQSATSADAPSRPPRALAHAITQFAPADAVLVDATLDPARGAAPALPGETGRALLWSGGFMARKWGHTQAALELRAEAASTLARGEWPGGPAGEMVRSLGREVWLVVPEALLLAGDAPAHVVARAGEVSLVRIER
jgi:hypothetical protein